MPIPKPKPNEQRDAFIGRCMADSKMNQEYPEADQRAAICNTSWKDSKSMANKRSLDVEIFATGLWNGFEFTKEDLNVMAMAFDSLKEVHKVPLKFGHNDEQPMTDGQPALGWVSNVWVAGNKLMAKFIDIPETVYSAIKNKLYRHVSVELDIGVEHKGNYYSWVLSGVALLGADIPAVNTLADLTTYMHSNLSYERKAVFTAVNVNKPYRSDNNMASEQELETLRKTIAAKDKEIDSLIASNTALKTEVSQIRADMTARDAADAHQRKINARANLLAELDGMVKEKKINPAMRDDFMRDYDACETENDTKVIVFTVEKMKKTIDSNPVYFGAEQAREKAKRDKEEEGVNADQILVNRANEYMAKHGEKDFKVAKTAILRADPELADQYKNQFKGGA